MLLPPQEVTPAEAAQIVSRLDGLLVTGGADVNPRRYGQDAHPETQSPEDIRDNFEDAIDFVGWYCHTSEDQNGIATNDAFRQYLAYHEGHGGYRRKTYRSKSWLVDVARGVEARAKRYNTQLAGCREQLEAKPWWQWW